MTATEKANILVVDDSPSKLLAMSAALLELDENVVTALSGREALRHLLNQNFAVILLDVNMPQMDGFETAALIRERERSAHVPIIFVTAYADDTHARRGYSLGAVDYMLSPVVPEVLRAKVSVFVDLYRKNLEVQAQAEQRIALVHEQAARRTAEAANRLKDEFLATLSHELRTPLNSIVGWVQLLKLRQYTEEELATGLEVIERNAKIQAKIIEDLLDISRIISGKLSLDLRPASVGDVAETAAAAVQLSADEKQITVVRDIAADLPAAMIDPTRLQQAILNLLSNAVKFTPAGGRIAVGVRLDGNDVEVSVADTGEGISPEFLPHVFERFKQADASTSRRHGGLGIGLALVRQLVEMQGGRIAVESSGPSQGSTFRIRIPALHTALSTSVAPSAVGPAANDNPDQGSLSGVRIVIVDDQRDARALLKRILINAEAEVFEAASAAEALELVRKFRPRLLISDIAMPDRDGFDLIRDVRSHPAGQNLPAIALTAYARPEERDQALGAGFQMHIAKPLDAKQLLLAVAGLLQSKPGEAGRSSIQAVANC